MNSKFIACTVLAAMPMLVQAQPNTTPASAAQPAATLIFLTGRVAATGVGGSRELAKGDPVFAGDTLLVGTNSYANLEFADGGRILLRPHTDFAIEGYRYAAPAQSPAASAPVSQSANQQAFFRLLRGGFRAISGFIGQVDRQNYRVATPVATIGIRGTDYEVQLCYDDCPDTQGRAAHGGVDVASTSLAGLELAQGVIGGSAPTGHGGVLVATNDGIVSMRTRTGEYLVKAGEVAYALTGGQVLLMPVVPDPLLLYSPESPADCN